VRNVPTTHPVFDTHFPRFPVLPGVLILADLVQVATLCLARRGSGRWRLAGVRRITWRRYVGPGDRMQLTVSLRQLGAGEAVFEGSVRVDGRSVATVGELRLAEID
jgi:3-hydroxyacyl-[acyl-carrier-protein] dehydratase